jgi:hypothetical protein
MEFYNCVCLVLQEVEWSVSVKAIVQTIGPMELVLDSRGASVSALLRKFITQKLGCGRRTGHSDACPLMKGASCRYVSLSHILVLL